MPQISPNTIVNFFMSLVKKTDMILILTQVIAPEEVVNEKLKRRSNRISDEGDNSDADWDVYRRVESRSERINRSHLVVDTSQDITQVIDRIIRIVNRGYA